MTTRAEVMRAVEQVKSRRGEYRDAAHESAASDQSRWDAIREPGGERRGESVLAADSRVAESNAATDAAFTALGRALVEMHALGVAAEWDAGVQGEEAGRDRAGQAQPGATAPRLEQPGR